MSEKNIDHRIEIGNKIAEIRQAKGLTQEQLAEMAGLQRVNISKIENGKYGVGIDVLHKISEALKVEICFRTKEYIMNIEHRLEVLAYNEPCFIQREFNMDEATLYHFICNGIEAACIVYEDGTLFHLYDWQSGRPNTAEEIEEYDWVREDGVRAIVFNGLPRVLE